MNHLDLPRRRKDTKKTHWTVRLCVFVARLSVAATGISAVAQSAQSSSAENGKRLFTQYFCYACHGTEGQGGAGPRLVARTTPDALIRYVRKPAGTMPAYTSKVISEQDLRDIHAYLRSVPPSPSAKDLGLLK